MRDVHLLELAKALGVDLSRELHLLMTVEEFIRTKEEARDPWMFRVKPGGAKYWINHHDMVASYVYPHLKELEEKITQFRKMVGQEQFMGLLKPVDHLQLVMREGYTPANVQQCRTSVYRVLISKSDYGRVPAEVLLAVGFDA